MDTNYIIDIVKDAVSDKTIKRCPWCGNEAMLQIYALRGGWDGSYEVCVQCKSCLARRPGATLYTINEQRSLCKIAKEAIALWNERADIK